MQIIPKSLKIIFTKSWINWLLILIPLGYIAHWLDFGDTWVFVINFFAMIPLANLLEFATENISLKVGQAIGGLLSTTFGNAIELIVSVLALINGQIRVVQASMLGSIISNLLFVSGISFVAGGIFYSEQNFNRTNAQTISSLMALACIGLIIPAAFKNFAVGSSASNSDRLLNLSRGTAIVLLIIYLFYIYYQLKTHAHLYHTEQEEREEQEEPQLSLVVSFLLLIVVTVFVAFSAAYLVGSIEGIVEFSGLSRTFVGSILFPFVSNAAAIATAASAALKNKMDLAISATAGSSIQIALFITPFLVVLGWIIGEEMSFFFHSFETVILFISVLMTNYLIQDGKTNWFGGTMLLATYIVVALAFFYYPNKYETKKN